MVILTLSFLVIFILSLTHNYFVGENSILVHNHCGNTNGDDAGRLWLKYKKYKVWIDTGEYLIDLIRGI